MTHNDNVPPDIQQDLSKINNSLYLSCEPEQHHVKYLKRWDISHILTIMNEPLPKRITADFVYKFVYLLDSNDADLLTVLPDILNFMQQATNAGVLLVHCMCGISRSASAIVAFLMQADGVCLTDALHYVRSKRRIVDPNEGFMRQLGLFEQMGCRVDPDHIAYKQYRLQQLGRIKARNQDVSRYLAAYTSDISDKSAYKCKKCRSGLFDAMNLLPHAADGKKRQFDKYMRYKSHPNIDVEVYRAMPSRPRRSMPPDRESWSLDPDIESLSTRSRSPMDEVDSPLNNLRIRSPRDETGSPTSGQRSRSPMDDIDSPPTNMRIRSPLDETGSPSTSQQSGSASTSGRNRSPNRKSESCDASSICDRSIFIEPVQWMRNHIQTMNGKLHCPKCSAKLGSYNWSGSQCACGSWITPAFHFQLSKVDRIAPQPPQPSANQTR